MMKRHSDKVMCPAADYLGRKTKARKVSDDWLVTCELCKNLLTAKTYGEKPSFEAQHVHDKNRWWLKFICPICKRESWFDAMPDVHSADGFHRMEAATHGGCRCWTNGIILTGKTVK